MRYCYIGSIGRITHHVCIATPLVAWAQSSADVPVGSRVAETLALRCHCGQPESTCNTLVITVFGAYPILWSSRSVGG